ncbi:Lipoprotein-releasing system transmembrane protein LolE [bacterium HR13]|nr:Lipoprotein-releasing system transmembrane protein LolE [bacterium HR13]
MNYIIFIAYKLLLERKRQTLVSVTGVAIGVGALIVMSSLMFGFQNYFIQQVIDLEAHISIKPKEYADEERIVKMVRPDALWKVYSSKPKEEDKIIGWREILRDIEKREDVVGVAPHLVVRGILKYGTKEKPVTLIGIDPDMEPKASVIQRFLEYKRLESLKTNKDAVILGKLVAKDLGIRETGRKVILVLPNGQTYLLKVEDFFNSGITNIDNTRVYMHIRTLQALMDRVDEVNEIVIKVKDVNQAQRIALELQKSLKYDVESWQRAYINFLQIFKIQNLITYMIVFAILTVSAFGIFNIIMMTVLEKKKDIAILMAMGYTRSDILLLFLAQGFIIGFLGAVLGFLLGYGLQEYLSSVKLEVEGLIRTKGFILDRSPLYYLYAFVFSIFFSFMASFYPSYKASKLNPVDIFRSG